MKLETFGSEFLPHLLKTNVLIIVYVQSIGGRWSCVGVEIRSDQELVILASILDPQFANLLSFILHKSLKLLVYSSVKQK